MQQLQDKHGVKVFSTLLGPLAQIPIFLTMFWTLRRMADDFPSLQEGGTLWFQNLAEADPTYGLPILCSLSFWAMVEFGAEAQPPNPEQAERMKMFMRGMALLMLPVTVSMPSAVAVYWTTTNIVGLFQSALFRVPGVKSLLGIKLKYNPGTEAGVTTPLADMPDLSKEVVYSTDPTAKKANGADSSLPASDGARSRRKARSERRHDRRSLHGSVRL